MDLCLFLLEHLLKMSNCLLTVGHIPTQVEICVRSRCYSLTISIYNLYHPYALPSRAAYLQTVVILPPVPAMLGQITAQRIFQGMA
jgi:hypothetical protein